MQRIDAAFDLLDHVIERATQTVDHLDPLAIKLGVFALLIVGLIAVWKNHGTKT